MSQGTQPRVSPRTAVRPRRAAVVAGLLALAATAAVPSAKANGLNPPPPPITTCNSTGSGTICRATLTTSFSFPAEFACSGFDVNEAGTTYREVVLIYDPAGNLTKRVTRIISLAGTFSNSLTGKSVTESGHFTITHSYLTPGDLSTDRTTIDGVFAKVSVPGQGIVLQDAGDIVFAPNGDVLREGGHHQFQNAELAQLCAALS